MRDPKDGRFCPEMFTSPPRVLPGAAEFIADLRRLGIPWLVATNNSTMPPAGVAARLEEPLRVGESHLDPEAHPAVPLPNPEVRLVAGADTASKGELLVVAEGIGEQAQHELVELRSHRARDRRWSRRLAFQGNESGRTPGEVWVLENFLPAPR